MLDPELPLQYFRKALLKVLKSKDKVKSISRHIDQIAVWAAVVLGELLLKAGPRTADVFKLGIVGEVR